MTFRNDVERSGGKVRRGGGGGPILVGGGLGSVVLIGLFLLLVGNLNDLTEASDTAPDNNPDAVASENQFEHCKTGADANNSDDCRLYYTAFSVNEVWNDILPKQAGLQYRDAGLGLFTSRTQTGCGIASSSTGPFYCPRDEYAYFDTSFFPQLRSLGGENAPFAQMYILAHEFGHHVQNIEGTLGLSNYNDPGQDSNAVKIELQADCYAGVWGSYADKGDQALLEPITDQQLDSALSAARAVGDDNIQKRSGGEINPESWTHGSAEQRKQAFLAGYESGQMKSCDFLERNAYRISR